MKAKETVSQLNITCLTTTVPTRNMNKIGSERGSSGLLTVQAGTWLRAEGKEAFRGWEQSSVWIYTQAPPRLREEGM